MKRIMCLLLFCSLIMAGTGWGAPVPKTNDTVRLFDTGRHSDALVERTGWQDLTDAPSSRIASARDLCVENGRLTVAFRRGGPGAELYYTVGQEARRAAVVAPAGSGAGAPGRLRDVQVLENSAEAVRLQARFGKARSVAFTVRARRADLEITPGSNVPAILAAHQSAVAVMPDFFGDDLVFPAEQAGSDTLHLPPDNLFLLHMLEGGDAMLMCNWPAATQHVTTSVGPAGSERAFTSTRIACGAGQNLGLSVLAAPGIWHAMSCSDLTVYEDRKVDWRPPFRAAWRLDLRRSDKEANGLTDCWYNLYRRKDGKKYYLPISNHKHGPYWLTRTGIQNHSTRSVWYSGLGTLIYPFYVFKGDAFLRLPKFSGRNRHIKHDGDILIYPLLRGGHSAPDTVLPWDVLRDVFSGEHEKALGIERLTGRPPRDRWPATCGVTSNVKKIFSDEQERAQREKITNQLGRMDKFVVGIRARIQEYLDWADTVQTSLAQQARETPELAETVASLEEHTKWILTECDKAQPKMRTPEYAATLSAQLIALIDSDAPDKLEQCDQLGREIRVIGGTQDTFLGNCRKRVKMLRQRAGLLYATTDDPRVRTLAGAVRRRAQDVLRIRFAMEGK